MHLDEQLIGEYIEQTLDHARRDEVDRHLAGCESCRQLVADLREIERTAATLELREPPLRAWSRIERAIRLDVEHQADTKATFSEQRRRSMTWLAAAAVVVLASLVAVRYGTLRRTVPSTVSSGSQSGAGLSPASVSSEAAQSIEAELREAEAHYVRAITGLEQIANSEPSAFDPATAAALQKNLAVIDQAITESRAALRAQPTSEPARESLMENFKAKLGLLQDTVALINEMRKGNEAGTARVVSGLKQKGD
jgi:hypothetical protein